MTSPFRSFINEGYSLWLSPALSDEATSTISSLISHLPGPKFPPHATLLGEAPSGTKLKDLLKSIEDAVAKTMDREKNVGRGKGLEVEFLDVRTGLEFFRCVLVKLKGEHISSSPMRLLIVAATVKGRET